MATFKTFEKVLVNAVLKTSKKNLRLLKKVTKLTAKNSDLIAITQNYIYNLLSNSVNIYYYNSKSKRYNIKAKYVTKVHKVLKYLQQTKILKYNKALNVFEFVR